MSLIYFLSKFSTEAILIELFLIGCLMTVWFGYLLTKRRKYGVAKNQIPDQVVRAFLIELIGSAEGFKSQLFGENFKMPTGTAPTLNLGTAAAAAPAPAASAGADTSALKAQLGQALVKQDELGKQLAALTAAKADLEGKLAAGGAAKSGEGDKALADKVSKLEAKLAEYEVIEDDLANLKKYQQENRALKEQLEKLAGGGAVAAATAAPAPAAEPAPVEAAPEPAPEPVAAAPVDEDPFAMPAKEPAQAPVEEGIATPAPESAIAAAEDKVAEADATKNFEGFVDKVEESLTPAAAAPADPVGASVEDPFAMPAKEPAAAAPAETAPAEAAPAGVEKSDADLLNEFERMLNS